jgi:ADP-ribose pyrophosphatase YjhB (NUDIX family)
MRKTETAGGVVINKNGEILVVSSNNNAWSLPKGHIDEGEGAMEAAKREIAEESGIKELVLVKPLSSYKRFRIGKGGVGEDKNEFKTIHMFLFKTNEMELAPSDPHNPEARWVKKEEVSALLTHPKDKEFFNRILFEL